MTVLLAAVAGGLVGAVLTGLGFVRRAGRTATRQSGLTDRDHEVLTAQFAEHAATVQRQVGLYADSLAAGDQQLRQRLRRFERESTR